jgi:hypothetical protein
VLADLQAYAASANSSILLDVNLDVVLDIDEGRLMSGRPAMAHAFEAARTSKKPIVIHFHGGLVSRDSALAGAPALEKFYRDAGAYPIIPVWKTGAWEVAQDIWLKIAAEALFKILVDRVTGFVHARIKDLMGSRSMSMERSLGPVTASVLADSATGDGDFSADFLGLDVNQIRGQQDLALTPFQEMSLEAAIQTDTELNLVVDAVLQGANLEVEEGARALGAPKAPLPLPSVADPAALQELRGDANTRGLGIGTAVAVITMVSKVINRFVDKSDHGLHATVVEEVLRKFYLGAIGVDAWCKIKEYTSDAFDSTTVDAAGTALLEEIKKIPAEQRLMLVGHSAGSIFICRLLKYFDGIEKRFEIVFLAPAATVQLAVDEVVSREPRLAVSKNGGLCFRMYSMNDRFESRDTLVRNVPLLGDLTWFYPRSLLYLISGILEQDKGVDVVDAPIFGLQRMYMPGWRNAADPAMTKARDFIDRSPERRVWAVQDHPDARFRSNSTSHGGFGAPVTGNTSMESVAALLSVGW